MKRMQVFIVAVIGIGITLAGYKTLRQDLVRSGFYSARTVGVMGCYFSVSAVEDGNRLKVEGLFRSGHFAGPVAGEVQVAVIDPGGKEITRQRTEFHETRDSHSSHSHITFGMTFDTIFPSGTTFELHPQLSLCPKLLGGEAAVYAPKEASS